MDLTVFLVHGCWDWFAVRGGPCLLQGWALNACARGWSPEPILGFGSGFGLNWVKQNDNTGVIYGDDVEIMWEISRLCLTSMWISTWFDILLCGVYLVFDAGSRRRDIRRVVNFLLDKYADLAWKWFTIGKIHGDQVSIAGGLVAGCAVCSFFMEAVSPN